MSIENGALNPNYIVEYEEGHSHNHLNLNDSHNHSHSHNHDHGNGKKFRITQTNSLVFMHVLVGCYFIVELVVGHITKSNALVADAFHMLSDVISLIIALVAVNMSKKTSPRNTFGWVRAEVLGSLVNSVFLLALCFSITVEAINRFVEPKPIEKVDLMLYIGGVGLFINLAGLAVFGIHDHEHGHGHSHNHVHSDNVDKIKGKLNEQLADKESNTIDVFTINSDTTPIEECDPSIKTSTNGKKKKKAKNMNMHGVFLHVLSDALGCLAVIISGLIIKYVPPVNEQVGWKLYVDPALSLIITILIVSSTIPLLIDASLVLLQTVPSQFDIEDLKKLVGKVPGVLDVHHFHVWSLNSEKLVASAHLKIMRNNTVIDEFKIIEDVKSLLHECDIHATTLQCEYEDDKPPGYNYDFCKGNECRKRQCCTTTEHTE